MYHALGFKRKWHHIQLKQYRKFWVSIGSNFKIKILTRPSPGDSGGSKLCSRLRLQSFMQISQLSLERRRERTGSEPGSRQFSRFHHQLPLLCLLVSRSPWGAKADPFCAEWAAVWRPLTAPSFPCSPSVPLVKLFFVAIPPASWWVLVILALSILQPESITQWCVFMIISPVHWIWFDSRLRWAQ